MNRTLFAIGLAFASACTVVDVARLPPRGGPDPFVLTGDLAEPYESLGAVQVSHQGALAFGFFDPAETDFDSAIQKTLLPEIRALGGDGAINVRFERTQYLTCTKAVFAVLFFIPLPTTVTISGEVVRLRAAAPARRGGWSVP